MHASRAFAIAKAAQAKVQKEAKWHADIAMPKVYAAMDMGFSLGETVVNVTAWSIDLPYRTPGAFDAIAAIIRPRLEADGYTVTVSASALSIDCNPKQTTEEK